MIRLHQFPPAMGLPNASPFCLKLETWLRMAGLEFEPCYEMNPGGAPNAKFPWIEYSGERVADTALIIERLKSSVPVQFDDWLSADQRGVTQAYGVMLEEHLYWCIFYFRWVDERYWPMTRREFFASLPPGVRSLVPIVVRRNSVRQVNAQGMGRHDTEQVSRFAARDLDALAGLLGDQPYMLGERPSSLDASAFGFLANILYPDMPTPLQGHLKSLPNLAGYCDRIRDAYYPDWSRFGRGK